MCLFALIAAGIPQLIETETANIFKIYNDVYIDRNRELSNLKCAMYDNNFSINYRGKTFQSCHVKQYNTDYFHGTIIPLGLKTTRAIVDIEYNVEDVIREGNKTIICIPDRYIIYNGQIDIFKTANDRFKRVIVNWSCIPRTESRYFKFTRLPIQPLDISPVLRKSAELQNFDEDNNDTFVSKRYKI